MYLDWNQRTTWKLSEVYKQWAANVQLVVMAQRLAHRGWRSRGPRLKSHPKLTSQSWSSYQLNQLGSKATSDSISKQLTIYWESLCTFYFKCAATMRHEFKLVIHTSIFSKLSHANRSSPFIYIFFQGKKGQHTGPFLISGSRDKTIKMWGSQHWVVSFHFGTEIYKF